MIQSAGLHKLEHAMSLVCELEHELGASDTGLQLLAQADTLLKALELVCFAEFRHPELVAEIASRLELNTGQTRALETRTEWIREQLTDLLP